MKICAALHGAVVWCVRLNGCDVNAILKSDMACDGALGQGLCPLGPYCMTKVHHPLQQLVGVSKNRAQ